MYALNANTSVLRPPATGLSLFRNSSLNLITSRPNFPSMSVSFVTVSLKIVPSLAKSLFDSTALKAVL